MPRKSKDKLPEMDGKIEDVALELVVPDPNQPREYFYETKIMELAASIQKHGLLQPILVRPIADGKYQIVHGERRYRACSLLRLKTIKAEIRELDDKQTLEIQIVENAQRENLNPIEEAKALQRMIDELGYTHERIAETIGKSREYVSNKLRLLNLPMDIRKGVERRNFSEGHARALLSLNDVQLQRNVSKQVSNQKLNVRETEQLVQNLKDGNVSRETSCSQAKVPVADLKVWNTIITEDGEARKEIPVDELISAYISDLQQLRRLV